MFNQIEHFYINRAIFNFFSQYASKRIVSIKRTVSKIFQISLLNVQYDLKVGGLNSLTYCTYNRDPRVRRSALEQQS